MVTTIAASSASADHQVITLPVDRGVVCLRGLSPQRLRFELEYLSLIHI